MRKTLLFVMLAVATFVTAQDNKFVIRGEMSSTTLCYSNETVKEVKLECTVDGQPVVLATSQVADGKFTFEGTAPEVLGKKFQKYILFHQNILLNHDLV